MGGYREDIKESSVCCQVSETNTESKTVTVADTVDNIDTIEDSITP